MAHKMPTTRVGCYRPAVLDGGSNPPISTNRVTARHCKLQVAGRLRCAGLHTNMFQSGRLLALPARPKGHRPRLAWRTVSTSPAAHALQVRFAVDKVGTWPAPSR